MPFPINTVDGLFHNGNPATNTPGTVVDADWLNAVQAAIIAIGTAATTVVATYPVTNNDGAILCNTLSGPYTVTLPVAAGLTAGKRFVIKNISPIDTANVLTIAAADGKTIDLSISLELMGREQITVLYDGNNWETI